MKLSIIPSDNAVYINFNCYHEIDMSWIPEIDGKLIQAIQWSDNLEDDREEDFDPSRPDGVGEIEFIGDEYQNLKITTLGVFQKAVDLWNEKKKEEKIFIQQQLEEEERLRKVAEEERQARFLEEFNKQHITSSGDDEDDDGEDIFYDIEELLKEI